MPKFEEVSSFFELSLAELAKSKLQSENIFCFLHSQHHISMKWYISHALGGVRVYVKAEDKDRAKTILETDESELLSSIEFPEPAPEDMCSNCLSEISKKNRLQVHLVLFDSDNRPTLTILGAIL